MNSLTFGDIFQYNQKEYIFLAKTEDRIYTAQILSPTETSKIDRLFRLRQSQNRPTNLTLYCYVILQTNEFKNRAAHLLNTGNIYHSDYFTKLQIELQTKDLKAIQEEILKKSTISTQLKELIKDIKL